VSIADITESSGNLYKTERKITIDGLKSKNLKIIPKETLLISIFASLGKTTTLKIDASVNQAILGLVAYRKLNKAFLKFYLNYIEYFIAYYSSSNTQVNLNLNKIKNLPIVIPPKLEQTAIANYLDRKTDEIDELIAKKEQLLKLYEEEKTAIINQAVTKGINPKVKLKDSGIEWLGEIPEHWEVKKLKYVANANPSNIDKKSKDEEDDVYLCNYVDVYKNDFISSDIDFMKATASENQIEKFILNKGDVIATKDSETPDDIANPALVIEDFDNVVCGYHLTHIKPMRINGDYLFRFFQSKFLNSYFEVSSNGVTRYGLSVDKFNTAPILNPPLEEQTQIVQYIESETARINNKAEKTKKLIELLKEYKTALISEVVTGKVRVIN
jgi:type I restriction enzyme S subunit